VRLSGKTGVRRTGRHEGIRGEIGNASRVKGGGDSTERTLSSEADLVLKSPESVPRGKGHTKRKDMAAKERNCKQKEATQLPAEKAPGRFPHASRKGRGEKEKGGLWDIRTL